MSDASSSSSETATPAAPKPAGRSVPVPAIIALLLVAAVGGWAIYIWITSDDSFDFRRFTFQQPKEKTVTLVPIKGQLFYNGEPMQNGVIKAYPVNDEGDERHAVAPLKPDGSFEFYTDLDGMKLGAIPGEYKLVLDVTYPNRSGQLAPDRVLPSKYYDKSTTPVTVTLTSEPLIIRETGDPAAPKPKPRPGGGRGPRKKRDPQAIVNRIMESDADGDGKISLKEASDRLKPRFKSWDTNKDGFLDKSEVEAGLRVTFGGGRGDRRKKRPM